MYYFSGKNVMCIESAEHLESTGGSHPPGYLKSPEKRETFRGEIGAHFPVTGASISRHLSVLKEADLIRDKREGKYIYYELNASVLEEIMLWVTDLKGETEYEKTDERE